MGYAHYMSEIEWTQNFEDGSYTASRMCDCGYVTTATVEGYSLFQYRQGAFVQQAFPDLTPDEREAIFMTGICGGCWDKMFGEDE